MTDIPALVINAGILVVTAIAALVAFVQAHSALAGATRAEKARDDAVEAQRAAAEALTEANRIAGDARDLLRSQDARDTERHNVRWVPVWDDQTLKWKLANHGLDTAIDVRLRADTGVMPRVIVAEDEIRPETAVVVEFPDRFQGQGFMPRIRWSVAWRSPLGAAHEAEGTWPLTGLDVR